MHFLNLELSPLFFTCKLYILHFLPKNEPPISRLVNFLFFSLSASFIVPFLSCSSLLFILLPISSPFSLSTRLTNQTFLSLFLRLIFSPFIFHEILLLLFDIFLCMFLFFSFSFFRPVRCSSQNISSLACGWTRAEQKPSLRLARNVSGKC